VTFSSTRRPSSRGRPGSGDGIPAHLGSQEGQGTGRLPAVRAARRLGGARCGWTSGAGTAAPVAERARRAAGRCSASSTDPPAGDRGRVPRCAASSAALAGVRRRFAPHQQRHAHALELAREGVPLNIIERQLGHANVGTTSTYLQGIDPEKIIAAVRSRRAPMMWPAPGSDSERQDRQAGAPRRSRFARAEAGVCAGTSHALSRSSSEAATRSAATPATARRAKARAARSSLPRQADTRQSARRHLRGGVTVSRARRNQPLVPAGHSACWRSGCPDRSWVAREGIPRGRLRRGRRAVADHSAHLVDR
jgi:hypothetical protein